MGYLTFDIVVISSFHPICHLLVHSWLIDFTWTIDAKPLTAIVLCDLNFVDSSNQITGETSCECWAWVQFNISKKKWKKNTLNWCFNWCTHRFNCLAVEYLKSCCFFFISRRFQATIQFLSNKEMHNPLEVINFV